MNYRKDGTPYPMTDDGLFEWCKDFEDTESRRIGQTDLWWGAHVSTVWLGIDHSFGAGRPQIFETMIFYGGRGGEIYMKRYATAEEALEGHNETVRRFRWKFVYPLVTSLRSFFASVLNRFYERD